MSMRKRSEGKSWGGPFHEAFGNPAAAFDPIGAAAVHAADLCGAGVGAAEGGQGWAATDTYRILNFVVLAGGLFLLLRKPVGRALESRIKGIGTQLADLERKKVEAEKELAAYERKMSLLSKETEQIIASYIQQGEEARNRILEEARASAARLEAIARRNIAHELQTAKIKLQEEIFSEAALKAEEIIRQNITPADQDKLIDEYLEKVVA
jgi:F-type H+-transporting ATPase subunit b